MTPEDLGRDRGDQRLKYAYARCIDQKLWDEIATLSRPTAVAAYSGGGYTFEGRDAIVDFLSGAMGAEDVHSSHKMHHPEIDLTVRTRDRGLGARRHRDRHAVGHHDPGRVVLRGRVREARTGGGRSGGRRTNGIFESLQPRGNVEGLKLTLRGGPDRRPQLTAGGLTHDPAVSV